MFCETLSDMYFVYKSKKEVDAVLSTSAAL